MFWKDATFEVIEKSAIKNYHFKTLAQPFFLFICKAGHRKLARNEHFEERKKKKYEGIFETVERKLRSGDKMFSTSAIVLVMKRRLSFYWLNMKLYWARRTSLSRRTEFNGNYFKGKTKGETFRQQWSFLLNYVGERPRWPIQAQTMENERK